MQHRVMAMEMTQSNASALRLGYAQEVAGSKRVLSVATGQARCTFKINNEKVPFQKCEDSQHGGCYKNVGVCYKLLCFETQDTTVFLNRKSLGYLQKLLVNEDFNGDNCISTKAISYFSPISAVLNHQPRPCLLQLRETHLWGSSVACGLYYTLAQYA